MLALSLFPMIPKTYTVLSEMSRDIGQVFFASVFLTPLLSGTFNLFLVYTGLLLSLIVWYLSVLLAHIEPWTSTLLS
jgi:hypothetical protein